MTTRPTPRSSSAASIVVPDFARNAREKRAAVTTIEHDQLGFGAGPVQLVAHEGRGHGGGAQQLEFGVGHCEEQQAVLVLHAVTRIIQQQRFVAAARNEELSKGALHLVVQAVEEHLYFEPAD